MPNLTSLCLNSCKIGNKGALDLANNLMKQGCKGLEHKFGLEVLELANNGIQLNGFLQLLDRFKTSNNLKHFDFSHNRFEYDFRELKGFQKLEQFLVLNKSLNMLNLSGCNLNDFAMSCIASGLGKNNSLVKLNVSENAFTGQSI